MLLLLLLVSPALSAYAPDLVASLPGANFTINFKHYSGYVQPSSTKMFHYWLTESMQNPSTDPLLLWLNGGPGCSSVGGLIEENGPFHVANFGNTVYLNKYAWNTFANVLFLESPAGVGYSYATDGKVATGDDQVATDNYNALLDFFNKFPEYKGREFYITGESYAGVYLPTLAEHIIGDKTNFPNFKGMAIGNGLLDSGNIDYRTLIPLYYYHGLVRDELYVRIRSQCCNGNMETCNVQGELVDPSCTVMINEALAAVNNLDPYNLYDTCYIDGVQVQTKKEFIVNSNRRRMGLAPIEKKPSKAADNSTITPLCAQTSNTQTYMNRADVRTALHIPTSVHKWTDCSNPVDLLYGRKYNSMSKQIMDITSAGVKILIYNGDVDTVCNHVMNMQFVTNLNKTISGAERVNQPWTYKHETPNVAGFMTQYSGNFDFLTVRGSGHFVPQDKPREALQMIYNFVKGNQYSQPVPF